MTLATSVLIRRPAAVEDVMAFCNRELLNAANPPRWDHDSGPGLVCIGNRPGLGLGAILDVTYRPDGPIVADDDEDGPVEGYGADEGSMIVGFDTAYGYGRGEPWGCSDLHAYFIVRLAQEFGPVTWQNEYTGDWHRSDGEPDAALLTFGDPELGRRAVEADAAERRAA
jgi:hypothetical protein